MQIDFKIEVVSNRFSWIADTTHALLDKIVRKTAFDIEARAKALTPVDTGALRASIYTSTHGKSNYTAAMGSVGSRQIKRQTQRLKVGLSEQALNGMLPEHKPDADLEAIVAVGVAYGVMVEFGTIRMPAHPFFGTAIAAVRPQFERAVAMALSGNTL